MTSTLIRSAAMMTIAALLGSCHQEAPPTAPYFPFPTRRDTTDTSLIPAGGLQWMADAATAGATQDFGTRAPIDDPLTGGVTIRAVRAIGDATSQVDVDMCIYDTPGLYGLDKNNPNLLTLTSRAGLSKVTVIRNPPEPENLAHLTWHIANVRKQDSFSPAEAKQVCAQYRPEPFIQEPPEPFSVFPKP